MNKPYSTMNGNSRAVQAQRPASSTVATLKAMTAQGTAYNRRFQELMGKKAPKFITSIISVTSGNSMLQSADPQSILSAAAMAATMDLDVNPNLGFSAIVPYYDARTGRTYAQFQIMTRGIIQLALRTGEYKVINCGPVYEDELVGYDILSGTPELVPGPDDGYRSRDDFGDTLEDLKKAHVVGFFAMFRTLNGYEKVMYWNLQKILNHGKKYSKSFASDLKNNRHNTLWSTNFRAMAEKTVLKTLLSKWGILSTSMQEAVVEDQKVYTEDGSDYMDSREDTYEAQPEPVDATPKQEAPKQEAPKQEAHTPDPGEISSDDEIDLESAWNM